MLQIRHKLFLGFGGLLLIILSIGLQSILRITDLGQSVDVILRENFRSVIACQQMKESLERIDSGLLFVLLGRTDEGTRLVKENIPLFEKALQIELDTITLPGEEEKAFRVRQLFEEYKLTTDIILDPGVRPDIRARTYFGKQFPVFNEIKATADQILDMNQTNMSNADLRARKTAASARRQMYIMLVAGIILALAFMLFINRWILRPIRRLTSSVEDVKRGDLELVLPVESNDEFGRLSEAFNEMAKSLREFRRSDRAKLLRVQRATQAAFNSLPEAIAVVNLDGQIEVATGPAKDIFGLTPNMSIAMLPDRWITVLHRDAVNSGRLVELQGEQSIIQRFVKGEERYFRPRGVPILDNEGYSAGVALLIQDITLLRQQDEMKRGVISTVSHQLKTPLTSLRMAIHLLLDEQVGDLSAKQAELLLVARDDSDRLTRIIDDLLDISRIEAGRVLMDMTIVAPESIIREAIEPFRRVNQDKGIRLHIEIPDDLPEVRADGMQIGHVISNLLSNALKYTSPGGIITISATSDDEWVRFSVTDTGKGIPGAYLGRVFEKFLSVPGEQARQGTGLGLAIAKEIVEAHGGTVGVDSVEGKGSTFTFTLRRADVDIQRV
jgi:NtrC-family two-component system sensor histidine kinase KinB